MKISKVMVVVLAGCLTGHLFAMDDEFAVEDVFPGQEFMERLKCWYEKNPEACRTFINQKNGSEKCTMLHVAAEKASADCVRNLLVFGARVGIKDAHGKTPLNCAVCRLRHALVSPDEDEKAAEEAAEVVLALKGSLSEVMPMDEGSK